MEASALHILTSYPASKRIQNIYPGLCTDVIFNQRLAIERQRSERTGHPFAYIQLQFNEKNTRIHKTAYAVFIQKLLNIIWEKKEAIDMAGCIQAANLHLMLIHTRIQDAKQFIEQCLSETMQIERIAQIANDVKILHSIHISMHPVSDTPTCTYIKGKPILIKNIIWHKDEKNQPIIKESYRLLANWENPNKGYIALKTPIIDNGHSTVSNFSYQYIKRAIDFVISSIILIAISLPLLCVAIIIKATSKGPVLFIQERVGQYAKLFKFMKFRSMYTNMDDSIHQEYVKKLIQGRNDEINKGNEDQPMFKMVDDPRITPIGKIIRKLSVDELPQIWNVLRGDMSLVGPRPPIPYEVKEYKDWHYRRITTAKPGITGLWQVCGRNTTTFEEMVRLDIRYVENWSLWLDIKILFKTFKAVFGKEGN